MKNNHEEEEEKIKRNKTFGILLNKIKVQTAGKKTHFKQTKAVKCSSTISMPSSMKIEFEN